MQARHITQWVARFGSAYGLLGAAVLALNFNYSAFGWVAFLLSNIAWIIYSIRTAQVSLLVMQLGFTATSLLGIYRWII